MNQETIIEKYTEACQEDLQYAKSLAGDARFDLLSEVCNQRFAYGIFFPICNGFTSSGIDFRSLCKLYSELEYNIEDDGDLSLVSMDLQLDIEGEEGIYKAHTISLPQNFIIRGHRDELKKECILKYATFHSSQKKEYLNAYFAIRFDWDTLKFLHDLIPAFKEMEEVSRDPQKGRDLLSIQDAFELKITTYIRQHKNFCMGKF